MSKLLIVGAGGHGRCCLDIARGMDAFTEIVFLDDNQSNKLINGCIVIGTIEDMSSLYLEYTKIFIAIDDNKLRKKITLQAKEIGYELVNLISSNCFLSNYANLSRGCVLFPFTVVESNAILEEGCILESGAVINHDAKINAYSMIRSNTVIEPNKIVDPFSDYGSHCSKVDRNSMDNESEKVSSCEYSFEVGV